MPTSRDVFDKTHNYRDIARIVQRRIERISAIVSVPGVVRAEFDRFLCELRQNTCTSVSEHDVVEMLALHTIAQPVFDALFYDYSLVKNNPVCRSLQQVITAMNDSIEETDGQLLDTFYSSVRGRGRGIGDGAAKQRMIVELFEKTFSKAFRKAREKLGIVHTPVEIVDFIVHSVEDVLQSEFGRSFSDENVRVLDPFTGTGIFIARLLQSGIVRKEDLTRKYLWEIYANEIVPLAYSVASINIENVYHGLLSAAVGLSDLEQTYVSFPGIRLTDTFQSCESKHEDVVFRDVSLQNSELGQEHTLPSLRVIIGNPPYSVGQKAVNDNAPNQEYRILEQRIRETYVAASGAKLSRAAYDSYIKAFRWASDRLDTGDGGVVAFITNNGWLDGNGLDGVRRCIADEFSSVYVFDLRGAIRGRRGDAAKKEGGNVFDIMTGVAITILVKQANGWAKSETADIFYWDIGDYLSREEKLGIVSSAGSIRNLKLGMDRIIPNAHGDWINTRSGIFGAVPLEPDKKFDKNAQSVFSTYAVGVSTCRDAWLYGFSRETVEMNVKRMSEFYNERQRTIALVKKDGSTVSVDDHLGDNPLMISWSPKLKKNLGKNTAHRFDKNAMIVSAYRPFTKVNLCYDNEFVERPGIWSQLFPDSQLPNKVICVPGVGSIKGYSALMVDCVRDYDTYGGTQCFPLYWYETDETSSLSGGRICGCVRRDGITDFIFTRAKSRYGPKVTKEDIFFYVYGVLHSPSYMNTFANDLKKMLPRLPLVDSSADFWAFSEAGRRLTDLHLNYEFRTPPAGVLVNGQQPCRAKFVSEELAVRKMSFLKKGQKDTIVYNRHIRVSGIPLSAYDYVVNGKPAIEWVMERYAVSVHKGSGIVNDPNCWGEERGNRRYILDLLLSIIRVSVETLDIVGGLPVVEWGDCADNQLA